MNERRRLNEQWQNHKYDNLLPLILTFTNVIHGGAAAACTLVGKGAQPWPAYGATAARRCSGAAHGVLRGAGWACMAASRRAHSSCSGGHPARAKKLLGAGPRARGGCAAPAASAGSPVMVIAHGITVSENEGEVCVYG